MPWPFYARPSLGWRPGSATPADVERVRARQRALDIAETFEWVTEIAPDLPAVCRDAGLRVDEHPLMVYRASSPVPVPDGIRVHRVDADDTAIPAGQVVTNLAFDNPGTDVGRVAEDERESAVDKRAPSASDSLREQIRDGSAVYVVAEDEHGVLAAGGHNPRGRITEIVGVGTLPSARRRGLAAAVTATLVADALRRGVEVVFLSADDDAVARVYERTGFERVGTAGAAEPHDRLVVEF
jgi:ribosomal protein S18 acetylase RimI-like enzyme